MLYDILYGLLHGGSLSESFSFAAVLTYLVSSLIVIFLTLPIHEFAHGFAATKLGDPTPRYLGRMTLNPMAHIDWMGAASILIFGFGWAKPVQVNSRYFKNPKVGMAITALAGPLANIIMAFVALLLGNIVIAIFGNGMSSYSSSAFWFYVYYFFYYVAQINISLAVFNLIPIPPLDGSRLLSALLPYKFYYALMRYEKYLFYLVLLLIVTNVLTTPLGIASGAIMNFVSTIASLPFKLFGVFA